MRDLQGKTIVITGASSGIGAKTAELCGQAGMNVALGARRIDKLEDVAKRVEAAGGKALCVACDVTSDEQVQSLIDQAVETFGSLDAVFANAGYGLVYRALDTPDDKHRNMFEVNYWGTIRTVKAAKPHLDANKDGLRHILICSSAASEIGLPFYGPYAATKAAQDSVACAMRAELRDQGIVVTSIHPVGTKTDFFDEAGQLSEKENNPPNMKASAMQSVDHVARCIVKALRKPKAEVWPHVGARLGIAIVTAFPFLGLAAMRKQYRDLAAKHVESGQ